MAEYLVDLTPRSDYVDRKAWLRSFSKEEDFVEARQPQLNHSRTVYVGNLSFYTREHQIEEHFSACGRIERLLMGLGAQSRAPCGFCFVVFEDPAAALAAVQDLNKTLLDDSVISVSWEVNLSDETRRWGRGRNGQVIDAKRGTVDLRRGGLGELRRDANGVSKAVLDDEVVVYHWVQAPVAAADKRQQTQQQQQKQQQRPNFARKRERGES